MSLGYIYNFMYMLFDMLIGVNNIPVEIQWIAVLIPLVLSIILIFYIIWFPIWLVRGLFN